MITLIALGIIIVLIGAAAYAACIAAGLADRIAQADHEDRQ